LYHFWRSFFAARRHFIPVTIKSAFEIYRSKHESSAQVVERALTLAICKHAPVIIRDPPTMQSILVAPNDSKEVISNKMTIMKKRVLAYKLLWNLATLFFAGILLWMLVSVTK